MLSSLRATSIVRGCVIRRLVSSAQNMQGLILGVYQDEESPLTSAAEDFNRQTNGEFLKQLKCSKPLKAGDTRVLYGLGDTYNAVAAVGLGKRSLGFNPRENWNEDRENIRKAFAGGSKALETVGMETIHADPCSSPDCAAEGACLSLFAYNELISDPEKKTKPVDVQLLPAPGDEKLEATFKQLWDTGKTMAEGQNVARRLMEMPANLLYPLKFAEIARELFFGAENVVIHARDKAWAEEQGMGAFLSVGQGSVKDPVFLEIHLNGSKSAVSDNKPVVLVGKGVCFDSGGISLKPGANMDKMRGDMGGAACVLASAYTLYKLNEIPSCGLKVLIPLVENMPSGSATKPGDIVIAKNGKSIKIDNTDAEGRLILADALCYADSFNPCCVVDVATLTGAVIMALGMAAAAVYSKTDPLWKSLFHASAGTGDRVWRMPLFQHYVSKMKTPYADLNNLAPPGAGAGSCTAAAFLSQFVTCESWAHLDIAGVMDGDTEIPYLAKGMTGRPTRTIVQWLRDFEKSSQ